MKLLLTFVSLFFLTIGLTANPEKKGKGDRPGRPSREEMMKKFDKDGDGKLSDDEKAEIRKAMANRKPSAHILEKLLLVVKLIKIFVHMIIGVKFNNNYNVVI